MAMTSFMQITVHCITTTLRNIAIHELTEDVEGAQFACLATKTIKYKPLANYGYGRALESEPERHYLKKHDVQYTECRRQINGVDCTHFMEPNASLACQGDSGGPVVSDLNGRAYSVGVLSAGDSCDRAAFYSDEQGYFNTTGDLVVSVPYDLNWICKWSGVCPPQADATKDRRPTNIWNRDDGYTDEPTKNI